MQAHKNLVEQTRLVLTRNLMEPKTLVLIHRRLVQELNSKELPILHQDKTLQITQSLQLDRLLIQMRTIISVVLESTLVLVPSLEKNVHSAALQTLLQVTQTFSGTNTFATGTKFAIRTNIWCSTKLWSIAGVCSKHGVWLRPVVCIRL